MSFALSKLPLEKSLNYDSDKWTELDLFSGLEGIWDSNVFCFNITF